MSTSKTYRTTQRSRGDMNVGPSDLTYTDTVHADGRVVSNVRGTCDGEYVNQTATRTIATPVDFARIDAARRSSGWMAAD